MIATDTLEVRVPTLLAADTGSLAPAVDGLHIHLVAVPFTPSRSTRIGDLTLATFTGSAAKVSGPGTQTWFWDPVRSEYVVQIEDPAGGWIWICTAAPTPEQVITGMVLTSFDDLTTWGSRLLSNGPVTIANINDAVVEGVIQFRIRPGFMTPINPPV